MKQTFEIMPDRPTANQVLGAAVRIWHARRGSPPLRDSAAAIDVNTSALHKAMNDGDFRLSTVDKILRGIGGNFFLAIPGDLQAKEIAAEEARAEKGVAEEEAAYSVSGQSVQMAGYISGPEAAVDWLAPCDRPELPGLALRELASRDLLSMTDGPGMLLKLRRQVGPFPADTGLIVRQCKVGFEPPRRAFNAIVEIGNRESRLKRVFWRHGLDVLAWMPGDDAAKPLIKKPHEVSFHALVLGAILPG